MSEEFSFHEMPEGFRAEAIVTFEDAGGAERPVAFGDADEARVFMRLCGALDLTCRLDRTYTAEVHFASGGRAMDPEDPPSDTAEALGRREREAYEAFLRADWRTADERLGEWLDAWRELREAEGGDLR